MVGVAGLAVGDGAGFKAAVDGFLDSCSHCRVVYRHGRLLGEVSLCGVSVVVCGVALGGGEARGCESGVGRLLACEASNGGGVAWGVCGDAICGC